MRNVCAEYFGSLFGVGKKCDKVFVAFSISSNLIIFLFEAIAVDLNYIQSNYSTKRAGNKCNIFIFRSTKSNFHKYLIFFLKRQGSLVIRI